MELKEILQALKEGFKIKIEKHSFTAAIWWIENDNNIVRYNKACGEIRQPGYTIKRMLLYFTRLLRDGFIFSILEK